MDEIGTSTLTEFIYKELLPSCLKCGLNIFDFYEMTLSELMIYLEAYQDKKEQDVNMIKTEIYSLAQLTASFVGLMLNGKRIPSYDETFNSETNIDLIRERFKDFANQVNKRKG